MFKKIICTFCFLILGCHVESQEKEGTFKHHKFIYIPIEKISGLKPGKITYEELTNSFGDRIYFEIKYGPYILPRQINTMYYPVDRIISYFGTVSERSKNYNERTIVDRTVTKERQTVSLFFYKDRLIDYSVYQEFYVDPNSSPETVLGNNATEDVKKKYKEKKGDVGVLWANAYCDGKYYYYRSNRQKEFKESYLSEDCEWENPGFEAELKKNGYYERKAEMDKGDYSKLIQEFKK